jgi:sulfotransferase family protein
MMSRRFFIAGCQRSGTTMMRLILESHKDIRCIDEQYSYEMLSGRLPQADTTSALLGFKIPVWSEQLLQAQLHWNEYSYLYGSEPVPNFYDREPLIFMVRSPLDTISSMMRLKVESDSWLQRVAIPVVKGMAEGGRLPAEFRADLRFAGSCADPEVAMGALYWKIKSSAALSYLEAGLPIHLVIYEHFVATPAKFLRGILQHVGADWDESVLQHHDRPHDEIVDGKAIGDTDPARAIDTRSVGYSRSHLTPYQIGLVARIAADLERRLHRQSQQQASTLVPALTRQTG